MSCALRSRKGEAEGKHSSERASAGAWILGLALLAAACSGGDGAPVPPAERATPAVATVPTEPAGPPDPDVAATVEQALVAATAWLVPAGSGSKYEGQNVEFWTKGDEVKVTWLDEKLTCEARKP